MSRGGDRVPQVILGVSAGIAAYKACELLRLLTEHGCDVRAVPTADALRFVGSATWEALSGHPVAADVWADIHDVPHVRIGKNADLVIVAPATADLIARAANGRADDLLTATLLTTRAPVLYAPAMHTEMWEHPATQENVATLRKRGSIVVDPASGRLTGADSGPGRLPEPEALFDIARQLVRGRATGRADLAGHRVLVTAGGTRERIDPVRFIGNRSSGRQGYALARTAVARGATVTVIAANVALPDPAGVHLIRVESGEELRKAVLDARSDADAVVMAAAVADFRPVTRREFKIKKEHGEPEPISLQETTDILKEISSERSKPGQVVVGFAAETEDAIEHGRAKLARKGCDLLVVNEAREGVAFESEENAATILADDGAVCEISRGPKDELADAVWDLVVQRLAKRG